jgi:diketogulonate reductase-like aldo/keto reductase
MRKQIEYKMKDGNIIPALGLGTWKLVGTECSRVIRMAIKLGYKHIDTAEIYGNQREIGEALRDFDRSKVFLTSKVWKDHMHFNDVIKACNRTLEDLKSDYLDLYLIHWPNEEVSVAETFRAFEKLLRDRKIKSVGVSNFTIAHLKDALRVAKIPITVNQVEFHPYNYQRELLDFCKDNNIVLTAYSPLGEGELLREKTIKEIADKYNRTPAQICIRWSLQKGIVVIPKASSEDHLNENLDIFDWAISEEDVKRLDSLAKK